MEWWRRLSGKVRVGWVQGKGAQAGMPVLLGARHSLVVGLRYRGVACARDEVAFWAWPVAEGGRRGRTMVLRMR
jgi:hypothetical protein